MKEMDVLRSVMIGCCKGAVRLFRNNVGVLKDATGRPVRYGLHPGSGDLIGWRTITITPDMIGQTIAQFVSIEVKAERGRVRQEQQNWLDVVISAGGVAGIVRHPDEAAELLSSGILQKSRLMGKSQSPEHACRH